MKRNTVGICVLIILVICLCLGSCFDLSISQALYDPQGRQYDLLAAYGEMFANIWLSVAGVMLIESIEPQKKITAFCLVGLGCFLNLFAIGMQTWTSSRYFPDTSISLFVLSSIVLCMILNALMHRLLGTISKTQRRRFAVFLLVVCFMTTGFTQVLKQAWERPRMRLLAETTQVSFQPWWNIGCPQKDAMIAQGIALDEFHSFPSGHAASAALSMIFLTLPIFNSKLQDKRLWLSLPPLVFTCIIACSRILVGAHFLSDVTIGIACTLLILFFTVRIFHHKKEEPIL